LSVSSPASSGRLTAIVSSLLLQVRTDLSSPIPPPD
jgi:hypothetical protein